MSALEQLRDLAKNSFNSALQTHKASGGRIVGVFCSYIPEELFLAAGIVPFRMRAVGSTKTSLGDTWFAAVNCSYVRHLFDLALERRFAFLDGVIFMNSCDHIRRMFDNWRNALDYPGFTYMFAVPHKISEHAAGWYREELELLRGALEQHFAVKITEEALAAAIRQSNQTRVLLAKLYELRKSDSPPITAGETLSVIQAGTAMPRDQFNHLLEALLEELPGRVAYPGPPRRRLMMVSGCLEEPEHLDLIEGLGAAVVDDSLCFGRRYFDRLVDESRPVLEALTERYLHHLSCPRMSNHFGQRLDYVARSRKDYRLDGIICEKLKFCDLWGGESFLLRQESKTSGLPALHLERELYGAGHGQIKTRVQAFLERLDKPG